MKWNKMYECVCVYLFEELFCEWPPADADPRLLRELFELGMDATNPESLAEFWNMHRWMLTVCCFK